MASGIGGGSISNVSSSIKSNSRKKKILDSSKWKYRLKFKNQNRKETSNGSKSRAV